MDKPIRFETVCDYNTYFGVETFNPLVSVVNFADMKHPVRTKMEFYSYGFYTIFLKETFCGEMLYGRNRYDYQDGTLVFLAPNQVYGVGPTTPEFVPKGYALIFHPSLLRGTELGRNMKRFTFFSYEVSEALHLSERERKLIIDCLYNIQMELQHTVDKHSRRLIVSHIELLLNYCTRFYDRQFITREMLNKDVLSKFESALHSYFQSTRPQEEGLPSVSQIANDLNLSSNYFGDMIKKETGKTAQEQIQLTVLNEAKERLCDPTKSVSEVAYELGFQYPQHFIRLFKSKLGVTPRQYRLQA